MGSSPEINNMRDYALAAAILSLGITVTAHAQPILTPASVTSHYAVLVHANYSDTLAAAKGLQDA